MSGGSCGGGHSDPDKDAAKTATKIEKLITKAFEKLDAADNKANDQKRTEDAVRKVEEKAEAAEAAKE